MTWSKTLSTLLTPLIFKIDIARAFRNLRVDPIDVIKFGIRWDDALYVDGDVAFGWTHGSASFQMVADAIVHFLSKSGCQVRAYIDDFLVIAPRDKAETYFKMLSDLFDRLGLPMNPDKRIPPCKSLICLGIEVNLTNHTLKIAPDKLHSIYNMCLQVHKKNSFPEDLFNHCWASYFIYISALYLPDLSSIEFS